eukprot:5963957-Alexandrium_andersonii.AAC.1
MAQSRVFVLGPPVQTSAAVASIIEDGVRKTLGADLLTMGVVAVEGPLRVHGSWGARGARRAARPGMAFADLWCVQVAWTARSGQIPSFAVVVADYDYFGVGASARATSQPRFETFAIIHAIGGRVKPGWVYDWFTRP